MWREPGVMLRDVYRPEELIAIEDPAGRRLTTDTDLDRLSGHMLKLSRRPFLTEAAGADEKRQTHRRNSFYGASCRTQS